jgi:hypothetical protein
MPGPPALSELVCGRGYVTDWNAVSAAATTVAVVVALWLPGRERRARRLERMESEARAADIVVQPLAGAIERFPRIINEFRALDGLLLDVPGREVLYGVRECRSIIEREAFSHQLPTYVLGSGELVVALARKWPGMAHRAARKTPRWRASCGSTAMPLHGSARTTTRQKRSTV